MAKKTTKKSHRKPCPPCTEGRVARDAFAQAVRTGRCSVASRALDKIKSEVGSRADHMTPGARQLAYRELLSKEQKVQNCRAGLTARARRIGQESSDANRFNGLLGLGFLGL